MKNKTIFLILCGTSLMIISLLFCNHHTKNKLIQQYHQEALITEAISYHTASANALGTSIILYNVQHKNYPHITIHRLQLENTKTSYKLYLQGIQGSAIQSLQTVFSPDFQKQLAQYTPSKDLLNHPILSWAILGQDKIEADIFLNAKRTAPNQISVKLIVHNKGKTLMSFSSQFTPHYPNETLLKNLQEHALQFTLDDIDKTFKKTLDDYTLSKELPFLTDNSLIPLNLF